MTHDEIGPIYGVPLIESLPLNPSGNSEIRQAMPSRADLNSVKNHKHGTRVVAGFEVLLNHWTEMTDEITRLRSIVEPLEALLADGELVSLAAENCWYVVDTPYPNGDPSDDGPYKADTLAEALAAAEKAKGASDETSI